MAKLRVLVVDDEEELVYVLAERLEFRGFEAVAVPGGAEAVARVAQQTFDVAVIDIKMPGIGGIEVMKNIKKIQPPVKVILMTGHGSTKEGEEGMAEGAFDYLVKPVDIEDLVAKIKTAAGVAG